MKRLLVILCALGLIFSLVGMAQAVPITFDFTGTVTSSYNWATLGSTVVGSYTYDTAMVDTLAASTALDYFWANNAANQSFSWDFTVTAAGVTRSTSNNQNLAGTNHHVLQLYNSVNDQYLFQANRVILSDDLARINLIDTGGTKAFGLLPNTAPTTAPNLSDFNILQGIYMAYDDTTFAYEAGVVFNFTTISVASSAVPEPGTLLLLGSGLAGLGIFGRRRKKLHDS